MSTRRPERVKAGTKLAHPPLFDNEAAASEASVLVLALLPHQFAQLQCSRWAHVIPEGCLVISTMAGVPREKVASALSVPLERVVRTVPDLARFTAMTKDQRAAILAEPLTRENVAAVAPLAARPPPPAPSSAHLDDGDDLAFGEPQDAPLPGDDLLANPNRKTVSATATGAGQGAGPAGEGQKNSSPATTAAPATFIVVGSGRLEYEATMKTFGDVLLGPEVTEEEPVEISAEILHIYDQIMNLSVDETEEEVVESPKITMNVKY